MNFNRLGEPDIWYCKPSQDYLPEPTACLVTGITPQLTEAKGCCEHDFAEKIRAVMIEPETLSVGYNSMRFDDEVTRNLFWRNLYDAYEREWANGCSRWDLFPFVLAVWALRPEGIEWPLTGGVDPARADLVTFRLEKLTQANGISHTHAHDAASDVEATIDLAKLIAGKQPKLWQWALANRSKKSVVAALESGRCTLDDSLKLFEEGTSLMKQCSGLLDKAEQKVVKLSAGPGGKPAEEPFLPGEG